MNGRDFIAWAVESGEIPRLRAQIAQIERDLAATNDRQRKRQLRDRLSNQVGQLWEATLAAAPNWPAWNELATAVYDALEHLAERAQSPSLYRERWMDEIRGIQLRRQVQNWRLTNLLTTSETPSCDEALLANLPPGSFCLQFRFTLDEAFLSRDDQTFYMIDNPVRKDTVCHLPTISSAGWKGNLRWTAGQLWAGRTASVETLAEERFRLALLFGDETGEEEGTKLARCLDDCHPEAPEAKDLYRQKLRRHFSIEDDEARLPHHAGRLEFYPTFFDRLDIEVINPHRRDTRAGTQPILLESVPADTSGWFTLVYVPFDLIGRPLDEVKAALRCDLPLLAEALKEMFCTYGFSAKKSSGFGLAKTGPNTASGEWRMNLRVPEAQATAPISSRLVPLIHSVTDLLALLDVARALCDRLKEAVG